jgi:hypothetical protein
MNCSLCGRDHDSQRHILPVGTVVKIKWVSDQHPDGVLGAVINHCDDGRAVITTKSVGVHTFHDINWLEIAVPARTAVLTLQTTTAEGEWYELNRATWNMADDLKTVPLYVAFLKLLEERSDRSYRLLKTEVMEQGGPVVAP